MTTPTDAKREIRSRMKAARRQRDAAATARAQATLDTLLRLVVGHFAPRSVFTYVAMAGEAGTRDLIDHLLALGTTVLVPRLLGREQMIAVEFPGWERLEAGRLGILSPASATPSPTSPALVLVPGLAFSSHGERLGFGAGYYDRWLAAHPRAVRVGACFEYQVCERVPVDEHDEAVDYLVTERRITACLNSRRLE